MASKGVGKRARVVVQVDEVLTGATHINVIFPIMVRGMPITLVLARFDHGLLIAWWEVGGAVFAIRPADA
jgi:hypothetical protein